MPASLKFSYARPNTPAEHLHNDAVVSPHGVELAIVTLASGAAEYAVAYRHLTGRLIGEDPVRVVGLREVLNGLLTVIRCHTGRLQVTRLDAVIRRFARRHRIRL